MSPMASSAHACLLKFFCQIISVDVKSLMTSFNIPELRSKLPGFNMLDMNHDPAVLQFLTILRYLEVAPLACYFSFLDLSSSRNASLSKYGFIEIHFKLLDVLLQILVIHQLRLKLHLTVRCSISLLPSNLSKEMPA